MFRRSLLGTTSLYGAVLRAPDDAGAGAQGDLLSGGAGGAGGAAAGAGADGSGAAAGAAAGAGAASGAAAAAAAGVDDGAKAAATEAARVAALTPEQKAAEAKAADGKADAPTDYKALKMPEGIKADDPVLADAFKLFGEHKLTPDAAQALVDFTAERDKTLVKAVNDGQTEAWTKMRGEWKADTEKNVTAEDRGSAKQFAQKLFDKKTADMLEAYGLTDHRGFVEAMVKAGKAIKDDNFVTGNAGANGAGSDARKLFPNSNMNP